MGRDMELIEAAREGNFQAVERVLSLKPKKPGPFASLRRAQGGISARDSNGYTALHYAALNNHKEVVKLLLSYSASCNSVDEAGSSPLHLAAWAGHQEVVQILLKTGPSIPNVNLTNGDKETSLHCAAQFGHTQIVNQLLEAGADPNIKNSKEETALDLAAQYGRDDTVSVLLESHPEMVGKYTAYGGMVYLHTPLHLACRNGHRNTVLQLIQAGIDINVRTSRGSALHEAGLCGKVEVARVLLQHNININIKNQENETVLEMLAELQTPRTEEIARIISERISDQPLSPYENVSVDEALESRLSPVGGEGSPRPRATTWQARERRSANMVEELGVSESGSTSWKRGWRTAASVEELDKRISLSSTTSGFSTGTASTLQGAASMESTLMSESEVTITGTLTRGDATSISSASSSPRSGSPILRSSPRSGSPILRPHNRRPASRVSQSTLTGKVKEKPKLPAKPSHIRPGLKPVQIPNVDDKLGIKPKKPPRRNLSISPARTSDKECFHFPDTNKDNGRTQIRPRTPSPVSAVPQGGIYSSRAGSKSFDELDDILCDKGRKDGEDSRRALSSLSAVDMTSAPLQLSPRDEMLSGHHRQHGHHHHRSGGGGGRSPLDSRHSCDGILSSCEVDLSSCDSSMSFWSASAGSRSECQQCIINSMSNRSLNIDCDTEPGCRFISQKQYKRKIRREGGQEKYSTLDPKTERKLVSGGRKCSQTNSSTSPSTVLVSKTTYKLRPVQHDSDLDSAGEESYEKTNGTASGLELMEVPLSPTHYDQPSTPEHDPPTAWEAESAIHSVLSFLRAEYNPESLSRATSTEPWMLLPLDRSQWIDPSNLELEDKSTCTQSDRKITAGRKLPAIPKDENCPPLHIATSPESEDSSLSEVVLRRGQQTCDDSIYQSIDWEKDGQGSLGGPDSDSNRVSLSSDKSQSLSILSPFDEEEEWSKICKIIDSFGADIGRVTSGAADGPAASAAAAATAAVVGNGTNGAASTPNNSPVYDYPTLKKREKLTSTVEEWLSFINMNQYIARFEDNGYDNINYIGGDVITKDDLAGIGITDSKDVAVLIESLKHRDNKFRFTEAGKPVNIPGLLEDWLASIDLTQYADNFRENLMTDMHQVETIWDEELASIVEVDKVGHRHRMLLSLAGTNGIKDRRGRVPLTQPLDDDPLLLPQQQVDETILLPPPNLDQHVDIPTYQEQAKTSRKESGSSGKASKIPQKSSTKVGKKSSEDKAVKSAESKKAGTGSGKGGLPDFSRKLSDIKARLKPVDDPAVGAGSGGHHSKRRPNDLTLEKKRSATDQPTAKPTRPDVIDIPNTHQPSQPVLEGPLCPMHAQSRLAARRKASNPEDKTATRLSECKPSTDTNKVSSHSSEKRRTPSASSDDNVLLSAKTDRSVSSDTAAGTRSERSASSDVADSEDQSARSDKRSGNGSDASANGSGQGGGRRVSAARGSVSGGEVTNGTMTLGRKKKKAPPPPTASDTKTTPSKSNSSTTSSPKSRPSVSKTNSQTNMQTSSESQTKHVGKQTSSHTSPKSKHSARNDAKKNSVTESEKSYKVVYHGNSVLDKLQDHEATREAIAEVKRSRDIIKKTGMPTLVVINSAELRTTIFEGQETLQRHSLSTISHPVQDTENPCMFGFLSDDGSSEQKCSHVFTAQSKQDADEILKSLPPSEQGQTATNKLSHGQNSDKTSTTKFSSTSKSGKSSSKDSSSRENSSSSKSGAKSHNQSKPKSTNYHNSKPKSDHLVARMRSFFQGGDSSGGGGKGKRGKEEMEGRRRRGGSVDNLLDSVEAEDDISNSRKKCSSIKNLTSVGIKPKNEVKITSV